MLWLKKHILILNWAQKHLSERQFLVLSSALVGLTAGLGAIILKTLVHYIYELLIVSNPLPHQNYLYLFFPMLGLILVAFYVNKFHFGELEKSTAFVLYSISKKSSLIAPFHMVAHLITSAITIGFGGSSGLEAPIATTGSAIGSNYARTYHLNYKQRTLLLSCGAAAGIAAAFNAPIAGVLFSIEILIVDVSATAFMPLIIASAIGALCSNIVFNEGILLSFSAQQTFNFKNIPYYLLLALVAGINSVYHTRIFLKIDKWFGTIKKHPFGKVFLGGSILTILIFLFPPLFGEGYQSIIRLSHLRPEEFLTNTIFSEFKNEWAVLIFLAAIVITKPIATGATLSAGGNGGNFAPSLMTGAFLGMFFARFVNLTTNAGLPESNFTLVSMAGVMGGVMHAPLTAIFLIAEITGGYGLMIPLMLVASLSYTVVKFIEPHSIDNQKLAKRGESITHDRDKKILSSITLKNILETDFQPVNENAKLRELINVIEKSRRNIFPILDDNQKLTGVILLDSIRDIMFNQDLYDKIVVKELAQRPAGTLDINDTMEKAMEKFDKTGVWNLPVVAEGIYAGFISKSSIFSKYRNSLIERTVH